MYKPTTALDILTKYVKGIDRTENIWGIYDLTFRHYRTGKVDYARCVPDYYLLTTITKYLAIHRKACVGVYQNTMYKSEILILISG